VSPPPPHPPLSTHAHPLPRRLADTNGELARALGVDLSVPVLGGTRMKRFSAIVQDGTITAMNVEPEGAPTGLTCSLADPLLKQL
jgi:peroxiredoxin